MYLMECVRCVNTKRIVNIANGITSVEFVYVIPTRRISHRVFLFNLITALHVSGVVTTHPQEHTQISSNFSTIAVDNSTVKCLPDAEDAVALCSWGWVVTTPETCRAVTRLNKKLWLMHLVGITYQIITMHGPINIKFNKPTFTQLVCFLLGNSPASEFYMPTFRNTLSGSSS